MHEFFFVFALFAVFRAQNLSVPLYNGNVIALSALFFGHVSLIIEKRPHLWEETTKLLVKNIFSSVMWPLYY